MTTDRLAQCHWPPLQPRYDAALRDAVAFVMTETSPLGVIATGTIIRGEAHPSSDLDVYVVHEPSTRRRIQRFFGDVPAEIFINPPHKVRAYFAEEHRDGRRISAHMVGTGFVVFDPTGIMAQLQAEAREWLARPDVFHPDDAERSRYAAASHLEDGADITPSDPAAAALILGRAVIQMLEFWVRSHGRPLPRSKALLREVALHEAELGQLVDTYVAATSPIARLEAAHRIADRTIGARGFFEWDSGFAAVASPTPNTAGP
jgi:hypothetical protein